MFTTVEQVKTIISNYLANVGQGGFITGTVSSINPLKIQINSRLEITEENLFISDNCIGLLFNNNDAIRSPLAVGDGVILLTRPSTTDGTKYIMFDKIQPYKANKKVTTPLENGGTVNGDLDIKGKVKIGINGNVEKKTDRFTIENLIGKSVLSIIDNTGDIEFWDNTSATPVLRMKISKSTGTVSASGSVVAAGGIATGNASLRWSGTMAQLINTVNGGDISVGGSGTPYCLAGTHYLVRSPNVSKLVDGGSYIEITRNGSYAVGCTYNVSDSRLKKNIKPVTPTENTGLSLINQIKLFEFDFKENDKHKDVGVIAQQLEALNEHLVFKVEQTAESTFYKKSSKDNAICQPDDHQILVNVVMAMQEQQKLIESLESKISDLKNEISNIKGE